MIFQNVYTGAAACDLVGQRLLVGDKVGNVHIWRLIDHEPKLLGVQECILEVIKTILSKLGMSSEYQNDVETIVPLNQDEFLFANGKNQIKIWNLPSNTIEHIRVKKI